MNLEKIQQSLQSNSLDGWLFYDFSGSDPIAYRILNLDLTAHLTRRWFYFIPARGKAIKLVHAIESKSLDSLPGEKYVYASWKELQDILKKELSKFSKVAMQYSPNCEVPYISRVDAGTFEFIKSIVSEIKSSALLVQHFESVLDKNQIQSHVSAATKITQIIDDSFLYVRNSLQSNITLTEYELQNYIWQKFAESGLQQEYRPIVAVGENSADPHYFPDQNHSKLIQNSDLVLIDLFAREPGAASVFYDVTWTAFIGNRVPDKVNAVFAVVKNSRDAAIEFIKQSLKSNKPISGAEVDDVARGVIKSAGYGKYFIHRTGHSISSSLHGNGANIDNFETNDTRQLLPNTVFSIEPGIYISGEFGIRSEVNVLLTEKEAIIAGKKPQSELVLIEV